MTYVDSNLLAGENVVYRARLHWLIYGRAFFSLFLALAIAVFAAWIAPDYRRFALIGAGGVAGVALLYAAGAWVRVKTSEFAVTNKRVIIKLGLVRRRTLEMNLVKVESVGVRQTVLERVVGCGTIVVVGSGGTKEEYDRIAAPLEFRKAVETGVLP